MLTKKFIAFTLSEVLLVLAIIGVTTALTLPSLNDNIEERKVVSKLRKEYASLKAITDAITQTYGNPPEWNVSSSTTGANMTSLYGTHFIEIAQVKKDCSTGAGCFHAPYDTDTNYRKFLMKDGSSVAIRIHQKSDMVLTDGECNSYGEMIVDVNGPNNGENADGYDTFKLYLCSTSKGLSTSYDQPPHPDVVSYSAGWVIEAGNRDYLKCNNLNWDTKRTCD